MTIHSWEMLCFVLLLVLIFKPVKKLINAYLDEHSDNIYKTLKEAEHIRLDASESIEFYKQQHKKFSMQADAITKTTDENISQLTALHLQQLDLKIQTKKLLYDEKISIYNAQESKKLESALAAKALMITQMHIKSKATQHVTARQMKEALNVVKAKKIAFH